MMYIVGRRAVFDKGIERYKSEYFKLGRKNGEEKGVKTMGGIVFETIEQAQAYVVAYKQEETHKVYEIEATEEDVSTCPFGPWFILERSCRVKNVDAINTVQ